MATATIKAWDEMYSNFSDENTIGDMLESHIEFYDEDDDESTTYTYRLIGIKVDGSDDIIEIKASCETEAEIIIESFHDGDYILESSSDDTSFLGEFAHQITNPDWNYMMSGDEDPIEHHNKVYINGPSTGMITWFTNFADADRYVEGKSYFENLHLKVVRVSEFRYEIHPA